MADYQELVNALTWLLANRIQQKIEYTHGLLGNGNGQVKVSSDPDSPDIDFVYVRPDRFSQRSYKVFNKRVQGEDGDPIIIGVLPWEPDLIQVVDLDWQAYKNIGWGEFAPNVTYHGKAHEWRDGSPGLDTFNVYRRQLGDLKAVPSISGSSAIDISSYSIENFGAQKQFAGIIAYDLNNAIPAGTGSARMALVYWDPSSGSTGALGVATGTTGPDSEAILLNRAVSPPGTIPIAHIRLAGGQSSISTTDIFDAREPFRPGLSFGTGTNQLNAALIPIADNSGLYTGSTVEAALEQIGFNGARVSKIYRSDFASIAVEASTVDINFSSGQAFLRGSDGFFGVGTTSPSFLIHALANANSAQRIGIENTNTGSSAQALFDAKADGSPRFQTGITSTASAAALVGGNKAFFQANGTDLIIRSVSASGYILFAGGAAGTTEIIRMLSTQRVGINQVSSPLATLHVDQRSTTGAIPVIYLDQADVSEDFIRFVGSAAAATLTQSIVNESDVSTATRQGWLKVYVQDDGNQITDQAYYIPIYTLA